MNRQRVTVRDTHRDFERVRQFKKKWSGYWHHVSLCSMALASFKIQGSINTVLVSLLLQGTYWSGLLHPSSFGCMVRKTLLPLY